MCVYVCVCVCKHSFLYVYNNCKLILHVYLSVISVLNNQLCINLIRSSKLEWYIHDSDIWGSLNIFPDFFRMGTFIDSTHMKL